MAAVVAFEVGLSLVEAPCVSVEGVRKLNINCVCFCLFGVGEDPEQGLSYWLRQ